MDERPPRETKAFLKFEPNLLELNILEACTLSSACTLCVGGLGAAWASFYFLSFFCVRRIEKADTGNLPPLCFVPPA
jgi:hypothetical protein